MKVAVATSFPDDPGAPHGGVEAVSVNLVQALEKFDDLDIHVITTRQACTSRRTDRWRKVIVHRLPWAGGSMLRNAVGPGRRQMKEYLKEIKPDIIHVHDTYGLMVKGLALPRVFTIHGFIYGDTLLSGSRFAALRSWIWRRIETVGWADQPHIISINPYVRERLGGITTGVIHDIDNPVSEPFFDIDRKERKGTIFSAANVTPLKNTLALVNAVVELAANGLDIELRLAGSIDNEGYVQQVRGQIREKGLEKQVTLLGRLNTERIREELSAASVFALTSLQENSPMAIEEAMAAGMPVVTSNQCGMPYMVRDGESGFLVDPNNPDDIARRLGQLLKNDDLRRSMGAKGREIALDRFHPAKVAARTREVYLRAIQDFQRK
ncbi:MAG TPA: glycosyltransferase family 4 protein [Sedimentisphaerales bacterium]|nr:glycosyltransferase family 4 protein [Sedimentisphaerales bacterium]